jgi:ribosome assembly protein 1
VNEDDRFTISVAPGLAGLAISPAKEAMRVAVLNANPRIMEAMLNVDVSVVGEALGKTYTVIAKRRGRVLLEDLRDGVNVFNVKAVLPVTESFGFADALRKQTSGLAAAQLLFSHWETVDVDPFWAPRTEKELEDLGREDLTEANNNLARKLVNSVRRRKGLKLEEKIVENAEKQRTLSKNK